MKDFKENGGPITFCLNCDCIMWDENPQTDAIIWHPKPGVRPRKQYFVMRKHGGFVACPNCRTDAYLCDAKAEHRPEIEGRPPHWCGLIQLFGEEDFTEIIETLIFDKENPLPELQAIDKEWREQYLTADRITLHLFDSEAQRQTAYDHGIDAEADFEWSADEFCGISECLSRYSDGQTKVFLFYAGESVTIKVRSGKLAFCLSGFRPSPELCWDSEEAMAEALFWLAVQPGDTDADFFANHEPAHLAWLKTQECELLKATVQSYEEGSLLLGFIEI